MKTVLQKSLDAKNFEPSEWLIGLGHDDSLLKEKRHPIRIDLAEISLEIPIYLFHVSGHLGVANSKAFSIAKLSAASKNPLGGRIRRFLNSSEPTGGVEEAAVYPFQAMAMNSVKNPARGFQKAIEIYAKNGITTAQDGAASFQTRSLLGTAAERDPFDIDVIAYVTSQGIPISQIRSLNFGQYEKRIKLGGIKLILDGSPQVKTAYLSKLYLKPPHDEG